MIITEEVIESVRSLRGGYTNSILLRLGVACPPMHGWKKRLIGKIIPDDVFIDDPINPGRLMINPRFEPKSDAVDGMVELIAREKRKRRKQNRQRRESIEYSYLVGALGTDRIKIGKTTRPMTYRLSALQTSCPHTLVVLATTPIGEKELHNRFCKCRSENGEWFIWCDALGRFMFDSNVKLNFDDFSLFRKLIPTTNSDIPISPCRTKYNDTQLDMLRVAFKKKFGK